MKADALKSKAARPTVSGTMRKSMKANAGNPTFCRGSVSISFVKKPSSTGEFRHAYHRCGGFISQVGCTTRSDRDRKRKKTKGSLASCPYPGDDTVTTDREPERLQDERGGIELLRQRDHHQRRADQITAGIGQVLALEPSDLDEKVASDDQCHARIADDVVPKEGVIEHGDA